MIVSTSRPTYPTSVNFVASTLMNGASAKREAARNLGLADSGRSDHQNIFRRDFRAQRLAHLLPAPPITQCDCDRTFGAILANDVLVKFVNDFSRVIIGDALVYATALRSHALVAIG